MTKYIIISRMTEHGAETLKKHPERIKEVNEELEEIGVRVLEQFFVLGRFDFLTIVEAEDEKAISNTVVELMARGTIKTETFMAIPIDDFIASLE
ncbi:GYD domain-containing protein [Methanolobus sp. ZRKC3]|uniref:GYD domain-containing protein n=1 Tax=Methanolobus sp. ZRKC3 TaxID=3125786 RepID=UPI003254F963